MTESELREFMREQSLRHESTMREVIKRTDEMVRRSDEMIRRSDVQIDTLVDLRDESRAQRAALFRVLDRLDGADGAPPAAA